MSSKRPIGSIVSLWRYPVKSMIGEELNASDATAAGLLGDRACALIDASNGKVASAKNPAKWGKLFDCRAVYTHPPHKEEALPPVRMTLPDGRIVHSNQNNVNEILSDLLGRPVQFRKVADSAPVLEEYWPDIEGLAHKETITDESIALEAPAGTFFDYAVIHLLTTNTIERLMQLYPSGRFEVRRFRPNIVIKLNDDRKDFIENGWIGHNLFLGDEVVLEITDPCARCVMTTLAQNDLPHDPGILRTAAQHNKVIGGKASGPEGVYPASVGVYARVLKTGKLVRGNEVRIDQ